MIMANSRCTLQLLFLGLLVAPAFLQQQHPCDIVNKALTRGTFSLDVSPRTYQPGGIYTVTISGIDNSTTVILQALSNSRSGGLWEMENEPVSCSGVEYVVQKNISGNGTRTRWTSPSNTNGAPVIIRAFVTFANGTTLLQSHTLTRDLMTGVMTPAPSTATHTASGSHNPTVLRNVTMYHHNWASSHEQEQTKGPYSAATASQTRSILLAAMQFLPVFLGFKLLS